MGGTTCTGTRVGAAAVMASGTVFTLVVPTDAGEAMGVRSAVCVGVTCTHCPKFWSPVLAPTTGVSVPVTNRAPSAPASTRPSGMVTAMLWVATKCSSAGISCAVTGAARTISR
ncbi:hypothetical protein, partial [Kitasatospora indigofera]|uniref:hypothetical protein n=1 Tax=Kitasatospora indigofera TaxID=67307 RepID=UPI0033BC9D7F